MIGNIVLAVWCHDAYSV